MYIFSVTLFFFNHPAPPAIYTLSLHDALPICLAASGVRGERDAQLRISADADGLAEARHRGLTRARLLGDLGDAAVHDRDRKSTRLNSSHGYISYAVFCLKKKKKKKIQITSKI